MASLVEGSDSFDRLMIGGMLGIAAIALLVVEFKPDQDDRTLALVFAPWTSARDAMAHIGASDSAIVRMGRYSFIVVVRPLSEDRLTTVTKAGAWFAMKPGLLAGCSRSPGQSS